MSYKNYKLALLIFLLLYLFMGFAFRYFKPENPTIEIMIYYFVIAILYHASLFVFILNAKSKGVENCKEKYSPSKLLPKITIFICISAVGYALAMFVIYGTLRSFEGKNINKPLQASLEKIKIASVDENISADKRERLASFYYRQTGESIYYLNEKNERQMYAPDDNAKRKRRDSVEITNKKENVLKFLILSAIVSLAFAIAVIIIFLRIRKKDLLKQKTVSTPTQ